MCDDCMDRAYVELEEAREKLDKVRTAATWWVGRGPSLARLLACDVLAILDGKTGD